MPVILSLSPALSKSINPPALPSSDAKTLFPSPSMANECCSGILKPILFFILLELSNRIKILAGTSPSPDPGGNGFA